MALKRFSRGAVAMGIVVGALTLASPAKATVVSCTAGNLTQLNTCITNANSGANQTITITIANDFVTGGNITALNLPSTSTMTIDGNGKTLTLGTNSGFDIRLGYVSPGVSATGKSITINNLRTSGGQSAGDGGAILIRNGALNANNLSIQGATAANYGGGIAIYDSDEVHTISRSVVSGNTATSQSGGGIFALGRVNLINSTVHNNTAVSGGGVNLSAGSSAGVSAIQFSTITGNSGSNLSSNVYSFSSGTQLRLVGSVLSDPRGAAARNCDSAVQSASYSVVGNVGGTDTSCGAAATGQIRLATDSAIGLGAFDNTKLVPATSSILVDGAPDALGTGITDDQTFVTRSGAFTVGSVQVSAPAVSIAPTSGSFGTVTTGSTSSATTFAVTNSGSGTLTFGAGASTVTGTNAGDFAVATDTCSGSSVPVGATCAVGVTFSPGAVGARSASLVLTNNAGDSPQTISLGGTGGTSGGTGGGGAVQPAPTSTTTTTPAPTSTAAPVQRTVTVTLQFLGGTARLTNASRARVKALAASVPANATGTRIRIVSVSLSATPNPEQEAISRLRSSVVANALVAANLSGRVNQVLSRPWGIYRSRVGRVVVVINFRS
jgi:hypothetical protein